MGWSDSRVSLYHYRTTTGREVDILLENAAGHLVGLEVKSSATVTKKDFAGLSVLATTAKDRFVRGVVLYTGRDIVSFGGRNVAMPVSSLWRLT